MNKSLVLASIIGIPLILSATASAATPGMQSFKMGDSNCDTSRSGGGGMGSSWSGMPGPGQPAPNMGMAENRMEQTGDPGARMGGMGNAPWIAGMPGMPGMPGMMAMDPPQSQTKDDQDTSTENSDQSMKMWGPGMGGGMGTPYMGMPGMGGPGMMGYGPPAGMMGQNQPDEGNASPDANSGNSGPGMAGPSGMGHPGMMMGMPGRMDPPTGMMGQSQFGEGNGQPSPGMGPGGSNSGMTMGMGVPPSMEPPGMTMGGPPRGSFGPWGAGPYGGTMMMNQGQAYPNAIENRLGNIERRLDELMRHIQNLPQN